MYLYIAVFSAIQWPKDLKGLETLTRLLYINFWIELICYKIVAKSKHKLYLGNYFDGLINHMQEMSRSEFVVKLGRKWSLSLCVRYHDKVNCLHSQALSIFYGHLSKNYKLRAYKNKLKSIYEYHTAPSTHVFTK